MDSDTNKRIQSLERTVDILARHLLLTNQILERLLDRLPDGDLSTVRNAIEENIELLSQVKRLSKN
ncbi:hypothetical protein NIES21_15440 [Anabaenopsis circularis NIES-21]|uniref:Uncharacterized protein n=1 Tax=Anabaenopsis circularis NIES-21 TaxID=1085406 RepID=A0A1Z4GDY1_9CYAN|nr:hypothetical protein NIES21_15440 [Anabaenopsis circularis NIES-21]